MISIFQANSQHLSNIYTMILDLAIYEGIKNKIKINEAQLGELLFGDCPQHFAGIAMQDDIPCGFVMFNFMQNNICFNANKGIYIENLYVQPAMRGLGIGTALFQYVIRKAKVSECSRIEWWVSNQNTQAGHFYEKLGAKALSGWTIYKCDETGMDQLIEQAIA